MKTHSISTLCWDSLSTFAQQRHLNKIKIAYEGILYEHNVHNILELISDSVLSMKAFSSQSKALRIAVEILQNISKHAAECTEQNSVVILYETIDKLVITTSNLVGQDDRQKIEEIFASLSDIDAANMKQHYRNSLHNASITRKGGAGIGLVDIVYRLGYIPEFQFMDIPDSDNSYFLIHAPLSQYQSA